MNKNSILEQEFLNRISEITTTNLENEQFGVSELALEMGISRSNLYIKVKTITKKSVSHFICRKRLEKALEIIRQKGSTITEIAYNVGFASPSYFIKCFHKHFGYSPGEFIKNDPEIKKHLENGGSINGDFTLKKRRPRRIRLVWVLVLLFIPFAFFVDKYYFGQLRYSKLEQSIAVLPLKNTGNDQETQILADGIMQDILNRLSQIRGLKVKSRISAEKYTKADLSLPKIAKEMGVVYVLEGSILKEKDRIRIYIQLIEAKSDNQVWSQQYDMDLEEIFTLVTDVSKQIADELKILLSSTEIQQIEKVYTSNTEAYILYQKGRFFWHRRTEEGLNKSIDYFTQALKLDSTYALAYAGLADAYFICAWWKWYPFAEGYEKSKNYAFKALEIDNNLAEAHATLGSVAQYYDYNWELAEKELLRAIELNPNCAEANQYYSEYLHSLGRQEQARNYINKAIELDPSAKMKYAMSSHYYYNEGKLDEALKEGEKVLELDKNYKGQYFINFMIYIRKGEDKKGMDNLLKFLTLDLPDEDYIVRLNTIYEESGVNGIIRFTIEEKLKKTFVNYYVIAQLYALLRDKETTLDYLNKAFLRDPQIQRMKYSYLFKFINSEPEFIALLEKMNFPVD